MIILSDFDDTAAAQNVGQMLLDRFQPDTSLPGVVHWREIQQRRVDGEISLAEYQEIAFRQLTTPVCEQAAYVRSEAQLRPGFAKLAAYCAARGVKLAVVSHGLDYYVSATLDAAGTAVPSHAVRTGEAGGNQTFTYDFVDEGCEWRPGNCKCRVLEMCREEGDHVVYAGDSTSDGCPAMRVDFVFARDSLVGFCQEKGLPYAELPDFYPVLDYVKARVGDGA